MVTTILLYKLSLQRIDLNTDNKDTSGCHQRSDFFVPCRASLLFRHGIYNNSKLWTVQIFIKAMPVNKNALIRYKTIDRCLRNKYRRWTLDDLVEACSDALYEMEGIMRGVSMRTVQADIQVMRSDKLGYNAPIEVYDNKYYRYADDDYSIDNSPINDDMYELISDAVKKLETYEKNGTTTDNLQVVLSKVKHQLQLMLL
jgi:hypothetical protein